MLALTRLFCRNEKPIDMPETKAADNPVLSIINEAGYMALFGAVARVLDLLWTQIALDITAGSKYICAMNIDTAWKLPAQSAMTGYEGLCVCTRNIGVLSDRGVHRQSSCWNDAWRRS